MKIHLMGGDSRQLYLADYISDRGFPVSLSYLGGTAKPDWDADILILPLPVSRDGTVLNTPLSKEQISLAEIYSRFQGTTLFGGKLPKGAPAHAIDYFDAEEVTLANAALTVEGALALAIEHTSFSLLHQPVLVLGAGRIGQLLALRLMALGAKVTVAARRAESLALCEALGAAGRFYEDIPYRRFRLVFNTVPAPVLTEERLKLFTEGTLLLELASTPGGFDPSIAESLGLIPLQAPGLPGKYAPESAAACIGKFIIKEMERLA